MKPYAISFRNDVYDPQYYNGLYGIPDCGYFQVCRYSDSGAPIKFDSAKEAEAAAGHALVHYLNET